MRRPGSWASLSIGAWIGLVAGFATAAADFGAHWLFMAGAGDRAWLGLRLVSLQGAGGVLVGAACGLVFAATRSLAERLRPEASLRVVAVLLGLVCSPGAVVLARLLWSGGKMSRLPFKSFGISATALGLALGATFALVVMFSFVQLARGATRRRALQYAALCLGAAFMVGKLNQWILPNLYDYLHATLSLTGYALYASATALLALRYLDAQPLMWRALSLTALPLIALAAVSGYASLRTLDQNQNVRVALLSPDMPHSRSLLLGTAELLPKVETRSADLAEQRAAAARARRSRVPQDASLPQLPDAHVLLITIDALRADHLSSYGYRRPLGREFAALAAEGQLFEHAYAQAPHSSYSLCSLFSSEYLHETTELGGHPPEQTLPRTLAADGYHTAAFYTQGIFHTAAERLSAYERDAFGFALHEIGRAHV